MCMGGVNNVLDIQPILATYQPIYRLDSEKIYGYGVLTQASHSNNYNLVELFELSEMIDNLQELELATMEQVIRRFKGTGKLFITMFCKSTEATTRYLEKMINVAADVGLALEDIVIELTERASWKQESIDKIREFKLKYNFLLAISDFGKSFSNNLLLLDIPADIIKINRVFIQSIYKNRQKRATVRAFIEAVKGNNIKIICEGIEEEEELSVLKNLGSDLGQGYYLGKSETLTLSPLI